MNANHHLTRAVETLTGPLAASGCALLAYGSRRAHHDLDLFLIQPAPACDGQLILGSLDLLVISTANCEHLLALLDPLVTEPILSGELLAGDPEFIARLASRIGEATPAAICHLWLQSLAASRNAYDYLQRTRASRNSEDCRRAFQNLGFAASYLSFARWYRRGLQCPVLLSQLLKSQAMALPALWVARDQTQPSGPPIDLAQLEGLFSQWVDEQTHVRTI